MTTLGLPPALTRIRHANLRITLSSGRNRSRNLRGNSAQVDVGGDGLRHSVLVRAVPRNVSSLVAGVASLARCIERAASRRSALFTDVTQLSASIALHSLRLAVTSKMIGAAALVASSRAARLESAAAKATLESASSDGSAAANTNGPRALAVALSSCQHATRARTMPMF